MDEPEVAEALGLLGYFTSHRTSSRALKRSGPASRKVAAKALINLYHSHSINAVAKLRILAQRSVITKKTPFDYIGSVPNDCGNHTDTGTGLTF